MVDLLKDGFEDATLNKWSVHGLTPTIITSPVHSGSYAVGLTARIGVDGSDMLNQVIPESPDTTMDAWVMFTSIPDDTYHEFMMLWTSDYVERIIAGVQRFGNEIWWFLAGPYEPPIQVLPGTVNLNQWYHVKIRRKVGASGASAIELWVNDALLISDTSKVIIGNSGVAAIGGWTSRDVVTEVFDDVTVASQATSASTLTFSCNPLSGTIPWDSVITGKLSNASGGIPNAVVEIQYIGVDGVTWYPTGITTITDAFGNYTTLFTFTLANGWTPGSTGTLRAYFAGDAVNGAGNSLPVTVTMNQSGIEGYLSVSATVNGVAVPASVTADGQTGTTPVTFTFTPSTPTTYTVNATYQGVTLTRTAVVSAGQTATLAFDFTGGSPSLLIPAIVAFGVVSIALIATRKGGTKQKKKRRK